MKVTRGDKGDNTFETGADSETIVAGHGTDFFLVNLDKLNSHTVLNLMGEGDGDHFGVLGLTSASLDATTADRVNIYGGGGDDRADFFYHGEGEVHVRAIERTVSLHSIESVAVGAFLTHGKAIGTADDDNLLIDSTDSKQSYLLGGAGADHLLGGGDKGTDILEGGSGADVIGRFRQGAPGGHAQARGGAGNDTFVLNYHSQNKHFIILDFNHGHDHFLITSGLEGFFDIDPHEARHDRHTFETQIDFHDDTIFYKGHAYATVEGVSHLSSSDFLFL